ncbi:type 1 glutamine amidotransferase [Streptomyces sp. YC504]|uniref:Type 1 glutamine amidotransferase n=2 Tax=Streptomyces mesophilus TaxID=1775132 RepID=A0A6G4XCT3_9ACTN|nr:type 1 glutamine amidotransferase domain-containing protein [Streptomyces mesophilus]NGO74670.1 type 1 glutamine amidotransferase [Streptomyces mesophilus]
MPMPADLGNRRALVITTNYGVEQDELVKPVEHLRGLGAQVDIAATEKDSIVTLVGDRDPGQTVPATHSLSEVRADDYDLLLIPGGTINADTLRLEDTALDAVRSFASSGRPVAAICHGPWVAVEADVLRGKTLTSYPSTATDVRNAGGTWVDKEVQVCGANGWTLITSRKPDDLPAFLDAINGALTPS